MDKKHHLIAHGRERFLSLLQQVDLFDAHQGDGSNQGNWDTLRWFS